MVKKLKELKEVQELMQKKYVRLLKIRLKFVNI